MNKDFEEAEDLISSIEEKLENYNLATEVVLCPPMVYAELVTDHASQDDSQFYAGVQNVSEYENGAYTGEVSAKHPQRYIVDATRHKGDDFSVKIRDLEPGDIGVCHFVVTTRHNKHVSQPVTFRIPKK